ncbi:Zinc finger CCCH domain-containing protein 7 [Nymphaea thermarum]|nr:Zinc finger CCCH domain-containing protein 7 [Nymphaea thermarum]
MDSHEELSLVTGSMVNNLKEPSSATGFRLRGPFFNSLNHILSLNQDDSGSGFNSRSSPTCGFNSIWTPINFETSSVRCLRALNLLNGRFFSAISGSSLDLPLCPVDTPGCICRKGAASSSDAGRNLSIGHPSSVFSRSSTTPYLEVGMLLPPSPKLGMQDRAIEAAVHSGSVDGEVGVECSDFQGRSLKLLPVASVDEDVVAEMEKSHTEEADRNQLVHIEGFEDVADAVRDEDLGLPFDGGQRKQEEQEDGRLVSLDANPSSSMTEEFDRVVVDELPTDSTIPMLITELEEGEIPDNEMQIPMKDGVDLLPKEICVLSETNFCNNTRYHQGPINVPVPKDLIYSNICPEVPENLASTDCPVRASFRDNNSDVPKGNAGGRDSLKIKANLPTDKAGVIGELESQKGKEHGVGAEKPDSNVSVPQENILAGDLAQVYKTVSDRKDVELHKGKKKRGPITDKAKARRQERKKQKRAEMNKKLGVKKLKLPISVPKPKPVSLCRFYMHGQCRQGKECKFSHDAVPLTKSQPCIYFANRSQPCLKGDACPFDHDLSKYPCHKFVQTGFCIRGDNCLFSHKLPPNGDASVNTKETCIEHEKRAEKSIMKKSTNVISNKKMAPQVLMVQQQSEKPLMLPSRVPEGVSFLSFEKPTVGDGNKLQVHNVPPPNAQDKTPVGKQNQNTEQISVETPSVSQGSACPSLPSIKSTEQEYKNAPSSTRRAISNALAFASKYQSELKRTSIATSASCLQTSTPKNDSHIGPSLAISSSGSSDRPKTATMILEEFLFGGAKT